MLKFAACTMGFARSFVLLSAFCLGNCGQAAVVSGDLAGKGNSAITFDPLTPTSVIVRFTDANLFWAEAYQLAFRTNNGFDFEVTNVMYSFDNMSYFGFDSGVLSVGAGIAIASLPQFLGSAGDERTIYFSYELPAGLEEGSTTQVILLANSDGELMGDMLANDITNSYVRLSRMHTAVASPIKPNVLPEPGMMTIATIGLGLAALRRRKGVRYLFASERGN